MAERPKKKVAEAKTTVEVKSDTIDISKVESTIEKKIEEVKSAKVESKKYSDEDMVMVASMKSGRTYLRNDEKPYDEYIFDKFGDVVEVRFGRLDSLRRKSGEEPFKTMLYVLDTDAVEQLKLGKIYANIGNLVELEKVFALPEDEFIRFVNNCPEVTADILRQILNDKLERKEDVSAFSLQIWTEKLGIDFDLQDLKR